MSLALLHILLMGFVLVLVVVLVLDAFPAEWWSNGVSECCTFSELDPQILRTVPTPRRPSAVVPRAVRRMPPLRNRIVTRSGASPYQPGRAGARPYRYANANLRLDPSIRYG
jgi:hypothetical protein